MDSEMKSIKKNKTWVLTDLLCSTPLARYYLFWPIGLTDLFLAATHSPKMCSTSQGEHAHIRHFPESSFADVRYYNPPP
jgi:hypothetical protein